MFKIPPIYGLFFQYKLGVKWVREPLAYSVNPDKLLVFASDTQTLRRGSNSSLLEELVWVKGYSPQGYDYFRAEATEGGKTVPFYVIERLELI